MFGKAKAVLAAVVEMDTKGQFQSPCAGNMFGKPLPTTRRGGLGVRGVSIPVCGEHVW